MLLANLDCVFTFKSALVSTCGEGGKGVVLFLNHLFLFLLAEGPRIHKYMGEDFFWFGLLIENQL